MILWELSRETALLLLVKKGALKVWSLDHSISCPKNLLEIQIICPAELETLGMGSSGLSFHRSISENILELHSSSGVGLLLKHFISRTRSKDYYLKLFCRIHVSFYCYELKSSVENSHNEKIAESPQKLLGQIVSKGTSQWQFKDLWTHSRRQGRTQ